MFEFKLLCLLIACLMIDLTGANRIVEFAFDDYSTTAAPFPTLPPDYIYHSDINTAYKLHNDKLNWQNSVESCKSEGARLAVIDTSKKLQYIISMRSWLDFVWTGIYRESREDNWKAVDDVPLPANLPWSILSHQIFGDCVAVHGVVHGLSSWSCDGKRKYVCEIPDVV